MTEVEGGKKRKGLKGQGHERGGRNWRDNGGLEGVAVREGECLVGRIMSVVVGLSASLSLVVVGLIQLAHCCGGGGVLANVALLMWECSCGVC